MQTAWNYSQPFTVAVEPAMLVQFDMLPTLIMYQPPGNKSIGSFSVGSSYTQNYSTNQVTTVTDQSTFDEKFSPDLSFGGGQKIGSSGVATLASNVSSGWDNSTQSATGNAYGTSVASVTTTGLTVIYNTALQANTWPDYANLTFWQQPFWQDQIYFAVHPQFAVWNYPSQTVLQPLGAAAIQVANVLDLYRYSLGSIDLGGNPDKIILNQPLAGGPVLGAGNLPTSGYTIYDPNTQKETNYQFALTPVQCYKLLQLDPFAAAFSQAATPPTGVPLFNGGNGSSAMGLQSVKYDGSSSQLTTFGSTYTQTFSAQLTASVSSGGSESFSIFGIGGGLNVTNTSTTSNQVQFALTKNQSTATLNSQDVSVTLQDWPLAKSGPNSGKQDGSGASGNPTTNIFIFVDSNYGMMAVQTPNNKIAKPGYLSASTYIPVLTGPFPIPTVKNLGRFSPPPNLHIAAPIGQPGTSKAISLASQEAAIAARFPQAAEGIQPVDGTAFAKIIKVQRLQNGQLQGISK